MGAIHDGKTPGVYISQILATGMHDIVCRKDCALVALPALHVPHKGM
jgi:hypothetical protein